MSSRVFVTGGSGFIGSHTVAALRRRGHEVTVLARSPEKLDSVLGALGCDADVAQGDMTDASVVAEAMRGCDGVIHAAGSIGVDGGSGPVDTSNVDGVRTVIGTAVELGVDSIVYTSSITAHLPSTDTVLTTASPLVEPLSSYGASKREAEELVRGWQDGGAPIATFTIGGVYGPISPHLDGSFAAIIGALGGFMVVPPGGLGVVDVRDLAEMLASAVAAADGPRRFMAGGRYQSWDDWTTTLADAAGVYIARHVVTVEEMIEMGRQFDEQRAAGGPPAPLSEEAAVIMTAGVPTDDTATLEALGCSYRPTAATFRDTVDYLRAAGHLAEPPT